MTETPEGTDQRDAEGAPRQEGAREAPAAVGEDDQAHRTSPPGNPEADRDAVEKGEENIGRVTGR